jgi:hypothetical protein
MTNPLQTLREIRRQAVQEGGSERITSVVAAVCCLPFFACTEEPSRIPGHVIFLKSTILL